jgi:hypothetical protein
MKTFIVVGSVFIIGMTAPVVAQACPNLTGTYVCPADDSTPESTLALTQKMENGFWKFTGQTTSNGQTTVEDIIADGIPHNVPNPETGGTSLDTVSCPNNQTLRISSVFYEPQAGNIDIKVDVSLDGQSNLRFVADGTIENFGPVHQVSTCIRQ